MNLLTNGFVNNCGWLFGLSEQFDTDIVELGLGLCVNRRERRCPCGRFRTDNRQPELGDLAITEIRLALFAEAGGCRQIVVPVVHFAASKTCVEAARRFPFRKGGYLRCEEGRLYESHAGAS
jgi:hypothetical protein